MGNLNVFLLFLIFIAVNLPAGGHASLSCPTAFELHGQKCYKALDLYASWPEAKGIISNPVYWLDGSDMLVEREWRWMGDHGHSVPFWYTFWAPGQPDLTKERCLEIRYDWLSKWNNAHCFSTRSIICEARAFATEGEIVNDTLQDP